MTIATTSVTTFIVTFAEPPFDLPFFVTSDLAEAIGFWDRSTYLDGKSVPGGIQVRTWDAEGNCVRDGWILHVQENGVVYLNTGLALAG